MNQRFDVLIVGAGHAGAQTALALRQQKFTGSIAVIGEEPETPYERPPLSKEYLSGEKSFERILIRPEAFWKERDVTMLTGRVVTSVDAPAHSVTAADGETIQYGRLIWAAGGHARRLSCSGGDAIGVHGVRTRADVDRMVQELPGVENVLVIGGGYIGLESAAVLTKQGKRVTVIESLDRVLSRVAGEPLSRFYEAEHRAHGVTLRLDTKVDCIETSGGRATGVRLQGGEVLPAEMVIVGIGIVPSVGPLTAAGAEGGNGIKVDDVGRTTLQDVFAVGDCALHSNGFARQAWIRLESVQNANDMANTVAREITSGAAQPYDSVPWFWSNQYDLKLQTVGLSIGYDQVVVRGDMASRSFTLVYLRDECVIALDCVNAMKDYVQGRALVVQRARLPVEVLQDTTLSLKEHWAHALQESN